MAFDRPEINRLTFSCDACPEFVEFENDNGPVSFAKAWADLKEIGWHTQKPVGYYWEHYCSKCALLAERDRVPRARA